LSKSFIHSINNAIREIELGNYFPFTTVPSYNISNPLTSIYRILSNIELAGIDDLDVNPETLETDILKFVNEKSGFEDSLLIDHDITIEC
jgi:hypothetical protein